MTLGFLIVISLALGLAAWLAFLWSVRSGQYDDPEGPKYRMLQDDQDVDQAADADAPGHAEPPAAPGRARDRHGRV